MEEIGGWEVKFDVLEKDVDLMLKSSEKVKMGTWVCSVSDHSGEFSSMELAQCNSM